MISRNILKFSLHPSVRSLRNVSGQFENNINAHTPLNYLLLSYLNFHLFGLLNALSIEVTVGQFLWCVFSLKDYFINSKYIKCTNVKCTILKNMYTSVKLSLIGRYWTFILQWIHVTYHIKHLKYYNLYCIFYKCYSLSCLIKILLPYDSLFSYSLNSFMVFYKCGYPGL